MVIKTNITLRIETIPEKKFVGINLTMSLTDNKTFELFSSFMPRRKEIVNAENVDVFDLIVYPANYFSAFNPSVSFTKWALIEVSSFENIPNEMETFVLSSGQYAVFDYKGLSTDKSIFEYIFRTWLPNSNYLIDNRPHFEVLGEKYKNNDPNSEEEIWVPIRLK
jgi:AraC family transcriptional regulator